jgi:hypothetical protein
MTSILKNTTIPGTGAVTVPAGFTAERPAATTTIIQWTNTGSQSYNVLAGTTPTLTNTSWTAPTGVNYIEVLVVAGGGGGASGGGGAGGLIYNSYYNVVPGNSYTVTVGAGGASGFCDAGAGTAASPGSNSVFATLTAIGGGYGGQAGGTQTGGNGGSGGGAAANGGAYNSGGTGTANQGNNGGDNGGLTSSPYGVGGGGGAGFAGTSARKVAVAGGGGAGLNFSISGTATWYAGGGGGGSYTSPALAGGGGLGGGGNGGTASAGFAATASTGGGGGGASGNGSRGGAGGSGIVIIRYTVSSTGSYDLTSSLRYNKDLRGLEVYKDVTSTWISQDQSRNFGGHNLHQYSQDLSNAYWTLQNNTLTSSNNLAPDGTATGALVTTGTGYSPIWKGSVTCIANTPYTMSGYFRAGTSTYVVLTMGNNGLTSTISAFFTFSTQAVTGANSGPSFTNGTATYISSSMTSVGNGWYRCSITGIIDNSSTQIRTDFTLTNSTTTYVWGLQLEQAISAGPYTKTVSATSPIPYNLGGYRTHVYTTTGTSGFTPACSGVVEVMVVAGGGGGSGSEGGGGGAGGLIYNSTYAVIAGQQYTVTVGAGGAGVSGSGVGTNGSNSTFGPLIAIGGGGGGGVNNNVAANGGSGGGGGRTSSVWTYGGMGVVGQGNPGGTGNPNISAYPAAGGGGAGSPGVDGSGAGNKSGDGGAGLLYSITGYPTFYAGGGGGAASSTNSPPAGAGGVGGGGAGGAGASNGTAGTANTGGGGGGGGQGSTVGGNGGSGIVVVRYRYD